MEFHERMAVVHALHTFWNPTSPETVEILLDAMDLEPEARALDVACGAGELLVRMAERFGVSGIGVDVSPRALARARRKAEARVPDAELEFVEAEASAWSPEAGETFDAVSLIGASWIWNGYVGTLAALRRWVRPGGLLLYGEPYWKMTPPADYVAADEGINADDFTTLDGIREAAKAEGFRLVYMTGSSDQDWDTYEMLQSLAADRWVRDHPDHPDVAEILATQEEARHLYLRWGRDVLGFAQFVLRAE